ncbi:MULTISPECIES: hypothetical protein [Comamonas]|uniref:Lipoprotein n=1 Tax=Comamonas avium TaxID=2762231 RepID=A0ABR8SFZ8_9BURK|nr:MULTISPECIES: hypothetical protein [Comamonas]MBD7962039.1 hypothetical protein [Comamonas avium]MBD9402276.1 hypothetical protein [Comamonas sp. CMM02]
MKRILKINSVLWMSILLTGCGIGLGLFPYAVNHNIKPYLQYWEKEGVTSSARQSDSRECGSTLLPSAPHQDDITFISKDTKHDDAAYDRARLVWQRCMINKGYRYNGDCSSDYAKSRPACGAP